MANTQANISVALSMNNTKFKKGLSSSEKAMKAFKSQITDIGRTVAVAFSVRSIVAFTKASFAALDESRKAEQQLSTALGGRILAQNTLIDQAKELQKTTLFGDDETVRAQAIIAAFTKQEAQIKRIIPLVQDFAQAQGIDLASAAKVVSKTLGSTTNSLSRYGITVEGAVGSSERLETLVNGLTKAFGGQATAAAAADTQLTQLKNTWNDFQEAFAARAEKTGIIGFFERGAKAGIEDLTKLFTGKVDTVSLDKWGKFYETIKDKTPAEQLKAVEDEIKLISGGIESNAAQWREYWYLENEARGSEKRFYKDQMDSIMAAQDANVLVLRLYESQLAVLKAQATVLPTLIPPGADTDTRPSVAEPGRSDYSEYLSSINLFPVSTKQEKAMKEFSDYLDTIEDDLENIEEDAESATKVEIWEKQNEAISKVNKSLGETKWAMMELEDKAEAIGRGFAQLGQIINQLATGAEASFEDTAQSLLDTIGQVLISLGGWAALVGGILVGGSAIWDALEGTDAATASGGSSGGNGTVTFKIEGRDLVGVLNTEQSVRGNIT